ncbi:MAG: hypothetical protein PHP42_11010, partial [Bacteroidota bacterium]|nr:hypothetical protein [Bacteroidota bacterium]
VAILLLSSMQQVFAAGTLAGTVITNKAFVTYNAGSNVRNDSSAAVTMTVGYKVSINQSPVSNSSTSLDSTTVDKFFTIVNSGNYNDDYKFTVVNLPVNWTVTMYKDTGTLGAWDAGDPVISNGGTFPFGHDSAHTIILRIKIPGNLTDTHLDSVRISVESNSTGPSGVTRVGGTGLVYHTEKITIAKPVITISGSQTATPANAIPGAAYQYTITMNNTGTAPISGNATLSFKLDNGFSYVTSSGGGSFLIDSVTWTIPAAALGAGLGTTRTVDVIIENTSNNGTGVRVGTIITIMDAAATPVTRTKILYNDAANNYTKYASALTPITVAKASGMIISLWNSLAIRSGNPGDTIRRIIAIKNTGNATASVPNGFSFTRTVTAYTPTVGMHQRYDTATTRYGTYTVRTDTAGATFSFRLAGGDSAYIMIADSIFANSSTDGASITNSYIVQTTDGSPITPLVGGATTQTLSGNQTKVTAPNISIVLGNAIIAPSVGTNANPAPGDSIEFTITVSNTGTGTATSVTISNAIPGNTSFTTNGYGVGKGILVDGTANLNTGGAPGFASCDGTTLNAGPYTIAQSGSKIIQYKIKVN